MSDQKLDTQIRREQIAEAALSLVASRGVGRLSMAAVARRVGLVPSGIYRHFKGKDEVLDAVLDLIHSRLMANVEAVRAETSDPMERLRRLLMRHIQFIRQGRAIPQILFSEHVHSRRPEKKDRVYRIACDYLGEVARLVGEGQQSGQIRPELDPDTVAVMFLGMVVPAGILWHLTEGRFDVTRHGGRAWEMFRTAILTPAT